MEPDSRKPNDQELQEQNQGNRRKLERRKRQGSKLDELLELCGEIGDGDGVDPRKFFKPTRHPRKPDRKGMQLCRQVARAIEQSLAGDLHDDLLRDLRVYSVQPAPDSKRLLVMLEATNAGVSLRAVRERVTARAARLRCEVASAITRKRAPVLAFEIVTPGDFTSGEGIAP